MAADTLKMWKNIREGEDKYIELSESKEKLNDKDSNK